MLGQAGRLSYFASAVSGRRVWQVALADVLNDALGADLGWPPTARRWYCCRPDAAGAEPMTNLSRPDPIRLRQQLAGARWIWGGPDPRPINSFRLFRKEFSLAVLDSNFDLLVSAEARYKALLNDQFVQAGPLPCQPAHRLVDRHLVRRFLRTGWHPSLQQPGRTALEGRVPLRPNRVRADGVASATAVT